jgi:hypothetical protein
MEMTMIDAGCD